MQYGFQRLVLLNSAGYTRAELPLDGAVSLVAPNNTGKTALINALQFLLIIDRRRMDFGAHDVDKSRRFYFPHNSAYVLLEVSLPESGTVVLGCVGKGVSFDYEYFAYAGPLDVEEFRLPNGKLVAQPQLTSHLATHQRLVFSYSSSEFADMIYSGGRSRRSGSPQDFCVFRLEHASDATAFQRVLTRTLRLDKLRSSEVKAYLLQIFRRDLPDASLDFKAEWDKAFSELNAERAQYLAATRQQERLDTLTRKQEARLELRGKLLCLRPMIDEALGQWQAHFDTQTQALQQQLSRFDDAVRTLREHDMQLARQQAEQEQEQRQLQEVRSRLETLQQRFALVPDRSLLTDQRDTLQTQRDELVFRIGQAQSREPKAVQRELQRIEQELSQLQHEARAQGDNIHRQLAAGLSAGHLSALSRALAKPVLTLDAAHATLQAHDLAKALRGSDADTLELPGLRLDIRDLPTQYQQRSPAELQELQQDLLQQQQLLHEQLSTARDLEPIRQQRQALDEQIAQLDAELRDHAEMQNLRGQEDERNQRLMQLEQSLASIADTLKEAAERHHALDTQRQQCRQDLDTLQQQHRQIEQRRNQRQDHEAPFTWLADLPHHPWLAQPAFALDQLSEQLQGYLGDCRQLLHLDDQIRQLIHEIHAGGLTKYQFVSDAENEVARLIEFAQHLPQEGEALEKKARSAVVNVAASLRELRDGLYAFKRRMREFNRKISGRRLSDLAVFRIEPEDESALVEAIELLIDTAATVDRGETFALFNQQSMLDDEQLNRAKTLLIEEGNARHGLRVADLFRLRFWVGKIDQEAEAFDDLDSAASNGTVLMAKLITGLAMLHLMQDQRRPIQGVCYLDEALALDARNQRSLIDTAAEFGFSLIFASPAPLTTVRYCVPIHPRPEGNVISRLGWQIIETLEPTS